MAEATVGQIEGGSAPDTDLKDSTGLWLGIAFCALYTLGIKLLAPLLPPVEFAPDTGFAHYFWKLPNPNFLSHATAWGGYVLHQIAIWACIAYAQEKGLTYSGKLHPVNVAALGLNALFILAHLLQTHFFYDGLDRKSVV